MAANVPKFSFLPLAKSFASLEGKDYQESFLKWSMKGRIKATMFSFDQSFQAYEKDKFSLDFFQDSNVLPALGISGTKAEKVEAKVIPCTVLSMAFFDKLFDGQIARESGEIKKCFDEFMNDFTISDNLRQECNT